MFTGGGSQRIRGELQALIPSTYAWTAPLRGTGTAHSRLGPRSAAARMLPETVP